MDDVYDPLDLYRTALKDDHARHTSDFFEDLFRESCVDEHANITTVVELLDMKRQLDEAGSSNTNLKRLRIAAIIVVAMFLYLCVTLHWVWLTGIVATAALVFVKLNPRIKEIDERRKLLKELRDAKKSEAWKKMEPLNKLYDWAVFAKLVCKTLPRIELDPYFNSGRLDSLRKSFGWDEKFDQTRSVVFSHSGIINGNPFALVRTLKYLNGKKTYSGTLGISWTETVRGSSGNWRTVTLSQTLRASVEKPFPQYINETTLTYGNQAAPDLSFSRVPSSLSGLKEGLISDWRKKRSIKGLEAKSRKITDGSTFTVMANREFEALFGATNRDHEVQFRLLFTPLAQQEMVKIIKDKEVGFGDDFKFTKKKMINSIKSKHLSDIDISADPAKFQSYSIAQAREYFNRYHNTLFKSFYFGFAPLLAIPLYQQHRPQEDIYKGIVNQPSCFLEHESIANFLGKEKFEHPESITQNILKTKVKQVKDGTQVVQVTAQGYRGISRVDYISVRGRDGGNHLVPVKWVEYIAVSKNTDMLVHDETEFGGDEKISRVSAMWQTHFKAHGVQPDSAVMRRSIVSAIKTR